MAIDPDLRTWIILVIANTPLYLALGKFFFGDWAGFGESLKFWLMPDIISFFRGEFWEDNWAELKLGVFFAICSAAVYYEHKIFFPVHPA